jgi:tRNA (guanosine-2'-O-)-methyltransferase
MQGVLARRQPDVAVVVENVHDPHNVSAVLRSCDATGVPSAYLLYSIEEPPQLSKGVSASANRWLDIDRAESVDACYGALRERGMTIYATTLGEGACELYDLDLTQPCAFVFGNESRGVSDEALEHADARLRIPMAGMVDSLNISVACAVILYEVYRQRRARGSFESPAWDETERRQRLTAWLLREGRNPATATDTIEDDFPLARNRYTEGRRS